jgi:hypothetical protein
VYEHEYSTVEDTVHMTEFKQTGYNVCEQIHYMEMSGTQPPLSATVYPRRPAWTGADVSPGRNGRVNCTSDNSSFQLMQQRLRLAARPSLNRTLRLTFTMWGCVNRGLVQVQIYKFQGLINLFMDLSRRYPHPPQ